MYITTLLSCDGRKIVASTNVSFSHHVVVSSDKHERAAVIFNLLRNLPDFSAYDRLFEVNTAIYKQLSLAWKKAKRKRKVSIYGLASMVNGRLIQQLYREQGYHVQCEEIVVPHWEPIQRISMADMLGERILCTKKILRIKIVVNSVIDNVSIRSKVEDDLQQLGVTSNYSIQCVPKHEIIL